MGNAADLDLAIGIGDLLFGCAASQGVVDKKRTEWSILVFCATG